MGVSKKQLLDAIGLVKEYADDLSKANSTGASSSLKGALEEKTFYTYLGFNYTTGCVTTPFVKKHQFADGLIEGLSNYVYASVELDVSHTVVRGEDNVIIHNTETKLIPVRTTKAIIFSGVTDVRAHQIKADVITQNTTTNDYYVLGTVTMTFILEDNAIDIIDYEVEAVASDAGNMNHEVGIRVVGFITKFTTGLDVDSGSEEVVG